MLAIIKRVFVHLNSLLTLNFFINLKVTTLENIHDYDNLSAYFKNVHELQSKFEHLLMVKTILSSSPPPFSLT
jgi:hypothetical protein